MEDDKLTPEQLAAEQEELAEAKVEDIREKLASDLGLSEEDNKDVLDKLVAREVDSRKRLSTAVRQKIDWRTKAMGSDGKQKETRKSSDKETMDPDAIRKAAEEAAEARLEMRDLEEMDYSDSIKEQIKKVAKLNGSSVRAAAKDPYIQSLVEQAAKQAAANEAADNGSKRSRAGVRFDTSKPLNPADFDLHTEAGRKEWADAKAAKRQSQS